jgi:hypothetical protein
MAAAVSSGTPFLGGLCEAANVLIISLEEHANDFAPRLVRFGADPERIFIVSGSREGLSLIQTIWKAAEEKHPSLIIWDTLGAYANRTSGKEIEPGDSQRWTTVMTEISDVAREFAATLILHHSRKSDGKYRDSTAIGANVDVILEMHGEGLDPRIIKGTGRIPIRETRLKLEGDEFQLLRTSEEVESTVLDFVLTHPRCSFRDLKDGVVARDDELRRARDGLVKKGAILNLGTPQNHLYIASGNAS